MNSLAKTLLGGAALCALATAPSIAGNASAFNISVLHPGNAVNKTKMPNHDATHLTYTFSVSTSIPASDLHKTVTLGPFFKFNSYSTVCSSPKEKIKFDPKKTQYAKLGVATETYSLGCASGPTVFYGVTYRLTNPAGEGQIDHFVSSLIGKFRNSHGKYKGTLNMDFTVNIGD
jgi:hypothetical protein